LYGDLEFAKKNDLVVMKLECSSSLDNFISLKLCSIPRNPLHQLMFRGKYEGASTAVTHRKLNFNSICDHNDNHFLCDFDKELLTNHSFSSGSDWLGGWSGSGLFIEDHKEYVCAGILIEIPNKGDNGQIQFVTVDLLKEFNLNFEFINSHDLDFNSELSQKTLESLIKDLTPAAEYEIDMSEIIGRENNLINLKKEINRDLNKISVINSIGGIGKTTLLKGYAKENKKEYNQVIYVITQVGLVNTFINNVVLLDNLSIAINPNISDFENYKLIMNAIRKLSGKTLFLIDDLKDDDYETFSQLPFSANCQIVGTTRLNLSHSFINLVNLDFLDFDSARTLFCKFYTGEVAKEMLEVLFGYIGYHTLTIELLAKTLETNFVITGVEDLTNYLKELTISNEDWQVDVEMQYDNQTINLKNHLLKAFKLISLTDLETKIICHFSLLPIVQFSGPELKKLFSIEDSQNSEFVNALGSLVKKGWLNVSVKLYQMHAMIQEVIKAAIHPSLQENGALIEGLCDFLDVSEYHSIKSKIKYISCAQQVLSIIPDASNEINTLNNMVAIGLSAKGDYTNALVYANKGLVYAKKVRDNHKVYQTYSTIGMINRHLGNLQESQKCYEKAIDIIEETSPKYITALQVYINFGTLLEQLGQRKHINQAKELYEFALYELEFFLKNNENERQYIILMATIKNSLGKIYNLLDKYAQAISLQKDSYDNLLALLGSDHEIVAITANNLGLSYAYNKDHKNSLKYHKIALSIIESVYDENHPEFSVTKSGLANAYRNAGQEKKAKLIFKEVLDIGKRNLPENHPTMARRLSNYASLCRLESESETAKDLYLEAIKIDVYNYGNNYPNVATCHLNLGCLFFQEKNWEMAFSHFTNAKQIYQFNNIENEFSSSTNYYLQKLNAFYPKEGKPN